MLVNLGEEIRYVTPELRSSAESLMVDTVTVTRPGADTFNPATGLLTAAAGTTIYEGPGRLRLPTAQESDVMFGEEQLTRYRFVACLPHDTTGVQIGDVLTITKSGDPDVVQRSYTITAVHLSTFTMYKAYGCEVLE